MKPTTQARKILVATLLAGSTIASTGCTTGGFSMASMNPFKSAPSASPSPMAESIASTASGAKNGLVTMGASARKAVGKTTNAVASVFRREPPANLPDATDPLALVNRPEKLNPEAYVANGRLWESRGDFEKAMESYVRALESEPNHPPAMASIARLHLRKGDHQQAVKTYHEAINNEPDDANLYYELGMTLKQMGNTQGAVSSLSKALELEPGASKFANNLAKIHFDGGNQPAAYDVLRKNNKPAVAHFNMAYLHYKKGQYAETRKHLSETLRYEPQAADDAIIKRAVDRSHEMLASLNANAAQVAQVAAQEKISAAGATPGAAAARRAPTTPSAAVQAPKLMPAGQKIQLPQQLPTSQMPAAGTPSTTVAPQYPGTSAPQPTAPLAKPTRPTMRPSPPSQGAKQDGPFALPSTFSPAGQ